MIAPAHARGAPAAAAAAEHVRIRGEQREILQGAAAAGVQPLLHSARILLDAAASLDTADVLGEPGSGDLLTIAGGLYTYAVEEYGKLLLLDSLQEKAGVVSVPHREIFRSRGKKFEAALRKLPADCALMRRGPFDPRIFDPAIFDTGMDESFASRTHLFYLDMGPDGHPVAPHPPDPAQLAKGHRRARAGGHGMGGAGRAGVAWRGVAWYGRRAEAMTDAGHRPRHGPGRAGLAAGERPPCCRQVDRVARPASEPGRPRRTHSRHDDADRGRNPRNGGQKSSAGSEGTSKRSFSAAAAP